MLDRLSNGIRKVWMKGSAQGHVQDLGSPADRQDGEVTSQDPVDQIEFCPVPFFIDHVVAVVIGCTVSLRMNIPASGKDDSVENSHPGINICRTGRKENHFGTRPPNGVDILPEKMKLVLLVAAVTGDADQGSSIFRFVQNIACVPSR